MKTVGIILREWEANIKDIPLYGIRNDLILFLRKYDVNVIGIPIAFGNNNELKRIKEVIDFCDGIILPGGIDLRESDYEIANYLYENDIPTFGICLGMQIMGATFNGGVRGRIEDRKS